MVLKVETELCFLDFNVKSDLTPIERKFLISVFNDFEDEKWRDSDFDDFLWDNVAQTALTFEERKNCLLGDRSRLRAAAKKLRLIDKEPEGTKGSEIAEIILYGIMRLHFNALPVVPKIFYKQNVNDYAKGADSVHITVKDEEFCIYFGEAKFYSSIENARLDKIVESVANSLSTEKLKKENSIITSLRELDFLDLSKDLVTDIRKTLSNRSSIDDLKPLLHVPILLLHECQITAAAKESDSAYLAAIGEHHRDRAQAYFEKQIESLASQVVRYDEITFHLFLLPVPSKKDVVGRFLNEANSLKGA